MSPEACPIPHVVVSILAAGLGTRMLGPNKLLEPLEGRSLVRHVAEAALASRAARVAVVLGYEASRVREALAGLALDRVHNPVFAEGMASSIRAVVASHGQQASAIIFCLGDMPRVTPAVINALIDAHAAHPGALACQPVFEGRRGNPVLWSARAFPALLELTGTEGARRLLQEFRAEVRETPVDCPGILIDVDTPSDLATLGAGAHKSA